MEYEDLAIKRIAKETKYTSAQEAISNIKNGKRIVIGTGCSIPQYLISELVNQAGRFKDNELLSLTIAGDAPFAKEEYSDSFRYNAFFVGHNVRKSVNGGWADSMPVFLGDIPYLLRSKKIPVHATLISVSPERNGYHSLGLNVDILPSAIESSDIVIAQLNKNLPFTEGPCKIPAKSLDFIVKHNDPIPEMPQGEIDEVSDQIGGYIAEYVKDGDTLQLGIGNIPDAMLKRLSNKNDLGIHSEMVSDGIIDLYNDGNITNMRKSINTRVSVVSFVLGTKKLYDIVNRNSDFEFYPTDYVNDPFIISKNDNVVSVNSALSIDLTGQVCSNTLGSPDEVYSGFGGQVDFVRGAKRSKGGRSFIAFPSTAKDGLVSRIVPRLKGGVVTTNADVQYIVTEFGVADLWGKNYRERALELIQIAHPDYREELMDYIRERKIVPINVPFVPSDDRAIRDSLTEERIFEGMKVNFRALHPTDSRALQEFFHTHKAQTVISRYNHLLDSISVEESMKRTTVDYTSDVAIGGFDENNNFVAIARYYDNGKNKAELGIVVGDDYQGKGIGSYLIGRLIKTAEEQGKEDIHAEFLTDNIRMRRILNEKGFKMKESRSTIGVRATLPIKNNPKNNNGNKKHDSRFYGLGI